MKKIIAIVLCLCMALLCAGCGKKDRILFKNGLKEYVTIGEIDNLSVDYKSEDYINNYDSEIEADAPLTTLEEGTVEMGDIANIDYEGKRDGVAFDGGTAKGSDLEIGSGSFIDGFEEGLVGVAIGETVDLDLKFPDDYSNSPDLAGAAVVFTVKVNSVQRAAEPSEYYSDLGFKSEKEYLKDVEMRAVKNTLVQVFTEKAEVKEYPEEEAAYLLPFFKEQLNVAFQQNYGMDLDTYMSQSGQTEADLEKTINENYVHPMLDWYMPLYAAFDEAKLKISDDDIDAYIKKLIEDMGDDTITAKSLEEQYGRYYFELLTVEEKVKDYLYDNAKLD